MSIITSLEQYTKCTEPNLVTQINLNDETNTIICLDELIQKFNNLTSIKTKFIH